MNRIKALRNAASVKQADLAKAVNVSPAALSGYETGKYEADIEKGQQNFPGTLNADCEWGVIH